MPTVMACSGFRVPAFQERRLNALAVPPTLLGSSMAALAAYIACPHSHALVRLVSPTCSRSAARASVWVQAMHQDQMEPRKPEKSRPGAGAVTAAMFTYFGVLHFPLGIQGLSLVTELLHQEALDPPTKAVSLLLLQSCELAGALWLVKDSLKETAPTGQLRFSLSPGGEAKNWALAASAGAGLLLLVMVGSKALVQQVDLPGRESEELRALGELLTGGGISAISTCLVVFGITPFMEELVYRGFLLGSLTGLMPWPLAVATSSLVFAGSHLTLAGFPGLFVVGIVLGLAYIWTENLATSFTIHCLYNIFIIAGLLIH